MQILKEHHRYILVFLFISRMPSILLDIISCTFISVPPKIVPFSFESPIYAGESTQVTCLVSQGDKPLDIQWFYNFSSTDGISTQSVGNKGSLLLIDAAGYDHKGNYTCRVKNSAGVAEFTALLNVHGTHCSDQNSFTISLLQSSVLSEIFVIQLKGSMMEKKIWLSVVCQFRKFSIKKITKELRK